MNQRLETLKQKARNRWYAQYRANQPVDVLSVCNTKNLSWMERAALLTQSQCETETPLIFEDERIVFTRTLPAQIPALYSSAALRSVLNGRILHEDGPINNLSPDWEKVLMVGVSGLLQEIEEALTTPADNPEAAMFLQSSAQTLHAVLDLADRYAKHARSIGRQDIAQMMSRVPRLPAATFHEALQTIRFLHAIVCLSGHYQIGFGRFDQYMDAYLQADLAAGRITNVDAYDLLAEFFISLNRDSDLYPGIQQGDNGQSLTLGGVDHQGNDASNQMTRLCLEVSRDVAMIDPKINLRIDKHTDLDLLMTATELTRKGLGFPQYSNDDVVIPGLVAHGYTLEDAREYAVAACWEFIVPGKGMDVVNIGAVSFPAAVDSALRENPAASSLDPILESTGSHIQKQVWHLAEVYEKLVLPPAPLLSALMTNCLRDKKDLSKGAKYNNFGIHGAGSANAADALAAIDKQVFNEKRTSLKELISALDSDFYHHEDLRLALAEASPKVGNDDDSVDRYLSYLFERFASACESYGKTSRGGILRPGTGSAMYYVWLTQGYAGMREPVVGATAEGRQKGKPLGANLSPTQGTKVRGPLSTVLSFAKIDYHRVCNGGPVTLELSDSIFRDEDSIRKGAMLVRAFAQAGGQQLQLNSVNVETLKDAKLHPEEHKNLIVRVWGWSGYFCELEPEYQDQIIARHSFHL